MYKSTALLLGLAYLHSPFAALASDVNLQQEISNNLNRIGQQRNLANYKNHADNFFVGPEKTTEVTVDKLNGLKDDTYVRLTGSLVERLDEEKFIFADDTGKVVIDIDDHVIQRMREAKISPDHKVIIFGVLDKEIFDKPEIEVNGIHVVQ